MIKINKILLSTGLLCLTSISMASPGYDAPICNVVGDSEAILVYDAQTTNKRPNLTIDLEINCDLDESKLNYFYNVKARITTKTDNIVRLYRDGQISNEIELKGSPKSQIVEFDLIRGSAGGLKLETEKSSTISKVFLSSYEKLIDGYKKPKCEKISNKHFRIDFFKKKLGGSRLWHEDLVPYLMNICDINRVRKLTKLQEVQVTATSYSDILYEKYGRIPEFVIFPSNNQNQTGGIIPNQDPITMRFDTSGRKLNQKLGFTSNGPTVIHTLDFFFSNSPSSSSKTVECASKDFEITNCGLTNVIRVELLEQYSNAHCSIGRSFKIENDDLVVSRGCRGKFKVHIMN